MAITQSLPDETINTCWECLWSRQGTFFFARRFSSHDVPESIPVMTRGESTLGRFWRQRKRPARARFEVLTQPHVDALWRVAFRMTRCRETADDLTQEACLKAFRAFDSYEEGTNYRAWIFRILTNLCADHLRRQGRTPLHVPDPDAVLKEIATAPHEVPESALMLKDFQHDLTLAIEALSPELRVAVSLSLLREMTYEEISQIVGCPIGTVRSRISRGRRQLRDALQDHLPQGRVSLKVIDPQTVIPPSKRGGAA